MVGNVVPLQEAVMATLQDLRLWIERDLSRFSRTQDHLQELVTDPDKEVGRTTWRFCLYTDNNRYVFRATESPESDYLGCIASSRKPRAGEDWNRGRDLMDGPLTEQTWRKILADIVSYEMVRVNHPTTKGQSGERLYPPTPEPTRLTTGDELGSQTGPASRAAPSSSTQTPPDR